MTSVWLCRFDIGRGPTHVSLALCGLRILCATATWVTVHSLSHGTTEVTVHTKASLLLHRVLGEVVVKYSEWLYLETCSPPNAVPLPAL